MSTRPKVTSVIDGGFSSMPITDMTTMPASGGLGGITGVLGGGGLDAVTGGLFTPISGFLTSLTGIDILGEIAAVKKYGLSSWGASTTPEKSEQKFNSEAVPYVQNIMASYGISEASFALTEINKYLTFLIKLETHKLKYHTKAKSTRLGRQVIIDKAIELRKKAVDSAVSVLRSKGAKITTKTLYESNSEIAYSWSPTDNSFHGDGGYNYTAYTVDVSTIKVSETNNLDDIDNPQNDEISNSSSLESILKLAGAAVLSRMIGII